MPVRAGLPDVPWLRIVNRLFLKLPALLADVVSSVRLARTFDAILVPGTGICDDFGERPQAMPYALLKWALAARLAGRPLSFVSIGAGPVTHPASRWLMKWAARLARYRSYRDEISKDFMESIGVDTSKDRVFPDVVFSLRAAENIATRPVNGRLTVGVGVMNYRGWNRSAEEGRQIHETYRGKIVQFVSLLLQHGHDVRLLIGAASDVEVVDDVLKRVAAMPQPSSYGRLAAGPAASLHELMKQMGETDVMVATRFHNVVCALMMAKPVISLGYARKNDVLLEDMGLGDFCQDVETFDNERLIAQLDKLVEGRERYAHKIRERTSVYRELLARQEAILNAYVTP